MTVALRVGNEGREIRALSQITWTLRKPPADSCVWVVSEFRYHWKLVPMNIGGDDRCIRSACGSISSASWKRGAVHHGTGCDVSLPQIAQGIWPKRTCSWPLGQQRAMDRVAH